MSDTEPNQIQMYSDYVCPFCYLGREALKQYQASRTEPLEVDWRPFDLRGHQRRADGSIDTSVEDNKDEDYYEQAKQNVRRLQAEYDVEMEMSLAKGVDSFDAQVVSFYVSDHHDHQTWAAFDKALFQALWQEGRDIGEESVLVELAQEVGVNADEVRSALTDDSLDAELRDRFADAQEEGITGVPTFVYGEYGARGAVPPAQFERLVEGV
jgi:predicted DsbA family dithiol-disulfide isomerase